MVAVVKCPVCAKEVEWTEASKWRPFCSERCQVIDLGDWAADRHVIPGSSIESPEDSPSGQEGSTRQRS